MRGVSRPQKRSLACLAVVCWPREPSAAVGRTRPTGTSIPSTSTTDAAFPCPRVLPHTPSGPTSATHLCQRPRTNHVIHCTPTCELATYDLQAVRNSNCMAQNYSGTRTTDTPSNSFSYKYRDLCMLPTQFHDKSKPAFELIACSSFSRSCEAVLYLGSYYHVVTRQESAEA